MPTYSQAGKFGPAAISGAPAGAPLRVLDASGSDAVLYRDASKNKTVGPIVQASDAGLVTFFADPGSYTVRWTGGSTTVTVTGGTFESASASATFTAADHGFLAWSADPFLVPSSGAPTTAGRLDFVRLHLPSNAQVTNIVMMAFVAGATLTSGQNFAALFRSDRTLIAQTVDQTTAWGTTGLKTMALAGGPVSVPAGDVLVGFWYNGTTSPAWARVSNGSAIFANAQLSSPNLRVGTADTGLTTTAPATMGTQTGGAATWWAGLS